MRAAEGTIDEGELVAALRAGDESSFEALVDRHHTTMLRVAREYVRSDALAEDVAQEAWLAVLDGIDRFEGRSSLRSWILRIVVNTAQKRGKREARAVPFSSLPDPEGDVPSVPADRFLPPDDPLWPGHWHSPPSAWPDEKLLRKETGLEAARAIEELPELQRRVVWLRDAEGLDAREVCDVLDITEGNQRVLLHRGRSAVRRALEAHLDAAADSSADASADERGRGERREPPSRGSPRPSARGTLP